MEIKRQQQAIAERTVSDRLRANAIREAAAIKELDMGKMRKEFQEQQKLQMLQMTGSADESDFDALLKREKERKRKENEKYEELFRSARTSSSMAKSQGQTAKERQLSQMGMAYREPKKQVVYHKDFDPAEKERD